MTIKQWLVSRKLIKEAYKAKKITGLPASIIAIQAIL
jgi:flagellum-specific peptidoglycan hydrolase FlgJ